jgi:hypothetical protein
MRAPTTSERAIDVESTTVVERATYMESIMRRERLHNLRVTLVAKARGNR